MAILPRELIEDVILAKLPVKSLLRFRRICKSWQSLIDHDKHFIKQHLDQSRRNTRILVQTIDGISVESLQKIHGSDGDITIPPNLQNYLIYSHCDGLLCLGPGTRRGPFVVANLAMQTWTTLPQHRCVSDGLDICKLLYNPSSEYIKLLYINVQSYAEGAEICTLGGDDRSWRKISCSCHPDRLDRSTISSCFRGAIHWISQSARPEEAASIVAFNIKDEKFRNMELPKCCKGYRSCKRYNPYSHTMFLVEINGFLQLFHFVENCTVMDTWVLIDYENQVWIRLHCLVWDFIPKELQKKSCALRPVAIVDREIMLWAETFLQYVVSYDFRLRRFSNGTHSNTLPFLTTGAFPYVESLLFPK